MGQDRAAKLGVALMIGSFLIVFSCATLSAVAPRPSPATVPPSRTPTPAQRPMLMFDNFDDANALNLRNSSSDPERYTVGYVEGEYAIRRVDPNWDRVALALVPGEYQDAALTVDARLEGDFARRHVSIACRVNDGRSAHYRLSVRPDTGQFVLSRWQSATEQVLVGWKASPSIRRGNERNRLELTCSQRTIAARINGSQVASVEDSVPDMIRPGRMWLGTYAWGSETVEARFDNLIVFRP